MCCHLLIFFKIYFFEKKNQEYIQSVSLDPHQARHFVRPGLGSNCLQSLSVNDTSKQNKSRHDFWNSELEHNILGLWHYLEIFFSYSKSVTFDPLYTNGFSNTYNRDQILYYIFVTSLIRGRSRMTIKSIS